MEKAQPAGPVVLLTPREVAARLRISVRKLWQLLKGGTFPQPARISMRCARWRVADVDRFIATA